MLLGDLDLSALSESFSKGSGGNGTLTIVFLVALMALMFGLVLAYWHRQQEQSASQFNDADALLADLCRSHGLSRAEGDLAQQVATWSGCTPPASVFVRPELWRQASEHVDTQGVDLAALEEKLFGDLPSAPEESSERPPPPSAHEATT